MAPHIQSIIKSHWFYLIHFSAPSTLFIATTATLVHWITVTSHWVIIFPHNPQSPPTYAYSVIRVTAPHYSWDTDQALPAHHWASRQEDPSSHLPSSAKTVFSHLSQMPASYPHHSTSFLLLKVIVTVALLYVFVIIWLIPISLTSLEHLV